MPANNYPTTLPGILKIVEALFCLAGFICAMIPYGWTYIGGGWVQFVTITALIGVVILLVAYTVLSEQLPAQMPLLVLGFYAIYAVFLFIAGILTAVRAGQWVPYGGLFNALAACAFFVLVAFILFVLEVVMCFKAWRAGGGSTTESHTTHTSHTTTTKTTTVTVS